MKTTKPFKLPEAFINQLKEFTNGFHLVTINSQDEFETHVWYPNKIVEMAMMNYTDIQSTAIQEIVRQRAVESELPSEDEEDTSF